MLVDITEPVELLETQDMACFLCQNAGSVENASEGRLIAPPSPLSHRHRFISLEIRVAHVLVVEKSPLDLGAAGESRLSLTVAPPVNKAANGGDEPEECAGKVDPDCVLHPLDIAIALGILFDVHAAEQAEQGDPEDKKHHIPDPDPGESKDEWYHVQQSCERGNATDNLCIDPFSIDIFVLRLGPLKIDSVQTTDCDCQNELEKVQNRKEKIAECHAKETHLDGDSRGWILGKF